MPNERLRAALLEHGITPAAVSSEFHVDQKTVERWIAGRLPYRKYRYALAARLGVDEAYLWPGGLPRDVVGAASEAEVLTVYAHRWEAPRDVWGQLFTAAEREIGILVYSGLFLAEDAACRKSSRTRPGQACGSACCWATRTARRLPTAAPTRASTTPWPRKSATRWCSTGSCAPPRAGVPVPPDHLVQLDLPRR